MSLKFKNPPINELIISTYFNPPIHGLRNEHIGLFWHSIKDEFPIVSQQLPLVNVNIDAQLGGEEIFPMPRYWMISSDDTNVMQIQKQAFMLNWRRRDAEYPYYENIKPIFDKYYSKFQAFISSETNTDNLQIDVCELTYINTVESCEYWSVPGDVNKIIPSFSIPTMAPSPKSAPSYNCTFVYAIDDDLHLRVSIRNAQSAQHPELPILVFEIRASGQIGLTNKSDADSWFDRGHQAISQCFLNLTNPDIQRKYWMPENNSK